MARSATAPSCDSAASVHGRPTVGVTIMVVAILVVLVTLVLLYARSLGPTAPSDLSAVPPSLCLDLTEDQWHGLAMADAISMANAARFPSVRMGRFDHLARAAARLGWGVRLRDASGNPLVPTNNDVGTAMRAGAILKLVPPRSMSAPRVPSVVCRGHAISWAPRPTSVLADDKGACARWLGGHGMPVPAAVTIALANIGALRRRATDALAARDIEAILGTRSDVLDLLEPPHANATQNWVVLKPLAGTCGRGITADLTGIHDVALALARSCRRTGISRWLVEQQLHGRSYRAIVARPPSGAPARLLYACERLPPLVVGDGAHTIDELLMADKNARTLWHPPAPVADVDWMRQHGVDPRRCVPPSGVVVRVRMPTNWAQGGTHWRIDPRTHIHKDNVDMLCRAARCLPGRPFLVALDVVGDMMVPWHQSGANGPRIHDVELNSGLEDIPGGCDWVPADKSRIFDAILQAYAA
ncbi:Cyanophycin synthetase incomplete domain containing protein [Pandoravirus macleodensis]|uniref:Cyanophycin synthetase incomplete domain containing protein n=1 Tax=Pandoravirus macleodensis TaxID=2107707 RepID=A0A2U7UF32_9VIRU|nr:Cyanophycin synthetase incomplete domain containing protein [Pandoravirus macleodensis]AVK77057.1 Cyanophycin synthetase incomplete domain containing protein [Pandoravirus macleodensis]